MSVPHADDEPGTDPAPRRVSDRRVVVVAALVVVVVLGVNLLSAAIPPLDRLLQAAPVLVVVLVAGTVGVLVSALRRSRP